MTEQPKTVVCTSCSAKFHVPDELIRGKLVKFRCRKCGEAIDVDGRKSARPPAVTPPPAAEITAVDTPATFSQRTLPPPRPPIALSSSSPNLHPWPEPPRTRSTTAPMAISPSGAPAESAARFERDPSNRGPKIAAVAALLMAAGLSGVGLAMRNTPGASPGVLVHGMPNGVATADPGDPNAAAGQAHAHRSPTRITDLPVAVEGVDPAAPGATGTSKSAEPGLENPVAARDGVPASAPTPGADTQTAAAPLPAAEEPTNAVAANSTSAPVAPVPAGPGQAPVQPASNPAPAVARGKGDFNTQAAREALEDAASRAAKCKTIDSPSGTARIGVTFAANGHVTNAVVESGPLVGTSAATCVASKFRTVKVPAFTGDPVQVHKSISF